MTCKSTLVVPLCTDCLPACLPAGLRLDPRWARITAWTRERTANCVRCLCFFWQLIVLLKCSTRAGWSVAGSAVAEVAGGRADVKCKYLLFTFAARRCEKIIKSSDKRSVNMANGNAFIICMAGRSGSSCSPSFSSYHACDLCIQ